MTSHKADNNSFFAIRSAIATCCIVVVAVGCHSSPLSRFFPQECVLEQTISKDELVAHLNRNIQGSDTSPGVSGWKSSNASVRVSGIPLPLPASIAVSAPRNLRVIVSNPAGGQEVDFGSNSDRFWVWTKQQAGVVTCRHEDTSLALRHLQLPINVEPEWLMEVLGVIPINGDNFELEQPSERELLLDLVSVSTSPTGQHVERVIRVNTCTGNIESHILRKLDGTVLAKALLDDYQEMSNGSKLPNQVRISIPEANMQVRLSLGSPEVNPASFASTTALWQMPNFQGGKVADIGQMSRQAMGLNAEPVIDHAQTSPVQSAQALGRAGFEEPGNIPYDSKRRLNAPTPDMQQFQTGHQGVSPAGAVAVPQSDSDVPAWAQEHSTQKVPASGGWQPSAYSEGAWQSSSVRHRQGQE
ncbi:hypothetical protein AB1L42_16440 [Thalassoglobus sp. JC818]|uniref:hypothetical protein n=1 Tax=Thalassoglobus sp. JC818 TaxID=3232136 RepID=UPI00345904B4